MKTIYEIILKNVKNKDVLDIGSCGNQGSSNKTQTLYSKIKEVANSGVGIDIEGDGQEILRENAETLNLGKFFDVIVAGDVIEHLHNPGLFLDNMHRHLKKGGILFIATPNVKAIGYLPFKGNDFHTCWYCRHTLNYLLKQHDFTVKRVYSGLRRRKNFFNDILRHYFANTLLFVSIPKEKTS